ncbi:discoidin domain-containing protein [Myxococcus sp. SDU36]|nr:discoidin domain-containing protein [Myxococcus sp. SDU36]
MEVLLPHGNTDGDFWGGSVTHTALQSQQTQPWWQVDLQASHLISNGVLYNRTDCCSDRLQNFRVRISEDGTTWQDYPFAGVAPRQTSFSINSKARYVRVQLGTTNNPLSLAEVQVFGPDAHMHFGGMYGFFNGGTYVNPYTGAPPALRSTRRTRRWGRPTSTTTCTSVAATRWTGPCPWRSSAGRMASGVSAPTRMTSARPPHAPMAT